MSKNFKSIRLSQTIRTDIASSMLASWEKRQSCPHDIESLEKALGDYYWLANYASIKSILKKIPETMLRKSSSVMVQVAGKVRSIDMSESRAHPYQDTYTKLIIEIYDTANSQMIAFDTAKEEVNDWETSRIEFKNEINTILNSVQTTGQLVQMWPEAEQYLPPFAADPSKGINLPALKTSRLNTLLGIQ